MRSNVLANAAQTNDPKAVETVAAEFGQQADELAETDPEKPADRETERAAG